MLGPVLLPIMAWQVDRDFVGVIQGTALEALVSTLQPNDQKARGVLAREPPHFL